MTQYDYQIPHFFYQSNQYNCAFYQSKGLVDWSLDEPLVVSQFCSGLRGIFSSHTGQHEKLVPVLPVQSILCTYCQIIFV